MNTFKIFVAAATLSVPAASFAAGGKPATIAPSAAPSANPDKLESPGSLLGRKRGYPLVVFVDGSNWAPASPVVSGTFRNQIAAFGESLGADFALADLKETRTGRERVNFHGLSPAPWRIPAIYVLDADGRTGALVQGVETSDEVKKFCASLPALVAASKERTKLFAEADKATGPKAAELIGKGLDTLSLRLARQHQDRIRKLSEADPKDTTGYVGKYGFNRDRFHDKVVGAWKTKKWHALHESKTRDEELKKADAALAEVSADIDSLLKNSKITGELRQDVLGVRLQLARQERDDAKVTAALDEIIAAAPDSDISIGAKKLRGLLSKGVKVEAETWPSNSMYDYPVRYDIGFGKRKAGSYYLTVLNGSGVSCPAGSTAEATLNGKSIWKNAVTPPSTPEAFNPVGTEPVGWDMNSRWILQYVETLDRMKAAKTPEEQKAAKTARDHCFGTIKSNRNGGLQLRAITLPSDGELRVRLTLSPENWGSTPRFRLATQGEYQQRVLVESKEAKTESPAEKAAREAAEAAEKAEEAKRMAEEQSAAEALLNSFDKKTEKEEGEK